MRLTIVAAVLAAAATTACGSSTPAAQQGQATDTPTSASGTSSVTSDKQKPAVKAELTMQGKPGLGLLTATNQGGAPITFQGWPKLSFTNAANEPAAIAVEQKLVPGEGPSITLQPGQTAFAGVLFDTDDTNSFAINEMMAELPGMTPVKVTFIGTDGQPIADMSKLKVSEAKVGTMQPAAQGVTVFD
ncbi:DUF4232 domain-containing protein [Lentzea sp. NPDC058450]|uniref:DUF4232 domain-containing protein n=1 Tax=Lentzea sp. NPDC058450 TaxID=3346505 RepID=UPI003650E275